MSPGNHTCNGAGLHTVTLEDSLVYVCSFNYQGRRIQPIVWEGPGVVGSEVKEEIKRSPNNTSYDCHTGKYPWYIARVIDILQEHVRTPTRVGIMAFSSR